MASEPTGGSIRDNDAMTTISGLLAALQRDGGRPRVTAYDDGPGPTQGERIELSGRVLGTWVAKAANLLTEELDVQPGDRVALDLPAHWRALYWGLALWSCGACVIAANHPDARALITTDPEHAERAARTGDAILVTLPALARRAQVPLGPGVLDEAATIASYGDVFSATGRPSPSSAAVLAGSRTTTYADLVPEPAWPAGTRAHLIAADLATLYETALAAWAADGSIVLSRGTSDPAALAHRLATEGAVNASELRSPARSAEQPHRSE